MGRATSVLPATRLVPGVYRDVAFTLPWPNPQYEGRLHGVPGCEHYTAVAGQSRALNHKRQTQSAVSRNICRLHDRRLSRGHWAGVSDFVTGCCAVSHGHWVVDAGGGSVAHFFRRVAPHL